MPERDTDLFQIRIRQMAEHRDINVVLGKPLSVLPKAERVEPIRNLLHRREPADFCLSVLDRQDNKSPIRADLLWHRQPVNAALRGRIILISVNSAGCVSTSIEPECCFTMMS